MGAFNDLAVQIALSRRGIRETGGRNRGTEIDRYNKQVGLNPEGGYAWCTSGLYDVFREASERLKVKNPFPKTAKAVRVWELRYKQCYEPNPRPGLAYVLDHGAPGDLLTQWKINRYTNDGHIGIVAAVNDTDKPMQVELPDVVATLLGVPAPAKTVTLAPNDMLEISGNTNGEGSREGNQWAIHHGYPEVSHGGMLLGYLDFERVMSLPD